MCHSPAPFNVLKYESIGLRECHTSFTLFTHFSFFTQCPQVSDNTVTMETNALGWPLDRLHFDMCGYEGIMSLHYA